MLKKERNLIIIKLKSLKLYLFIVLLVLLLVISPKVKASSYNYDKNNDIISSPSAYFISQFLDLNKMIPNEFSDKKIKAIELTYISDKKGRTMEIIVLAHLFDKGSNKAKGILFLFDSSYTYKTHIITTPEVFIPDAPTSICYTNGFIYIGGSEEHNKFIKTLINPITKEVIANSNDILTQAIEAKFNSIYEELKTISTEKAALFKRDYNNSFKAQAFIYKYKRVENGILLALDKPLKFEKTIGLNSRDMSILKTPFRPLKICANPNAEMFYVISADSEMGILAFRLDGTFVKFIGINKIELSLREKLWRKLISDEVLDSEARKTQLNFTAMALDNSGFLYTVTSASKYNPVQRFNQAGKNILVEDKSKRIQGDYIQKSFENKNSIASKFSLISASSYKTYVLYDSNNNKLFAYNNNGELMFLYGSKGSSIEQLNNVKDIKIINQTFLLLENDNYSNYIKVLSPTRYGRLINQSAINYASGNYDKSSLIYKELLMLNSNCEYAYNGLGKIALLNGEYKKACSYFKQANNKLLYLEAYEKYRNLQIEEGIYLLFSLVLLVFSISVSKKMFFKK